MLHVTHAGIRTVLDRECAHVKFDHALLLRAQRMQEGFINKKPEHVEFFGGNLTGVQVVRFTDVDRDLLFDTILQTDESLLERDLYALKDEHGKHIIDQTHSRGSDVFNIACVYAIHRFHHTPDLDENQRMEAKTRICTYMHYKFLTSLMYWYFKFPADRAVAAATYAELSLKFSLRQYGSWGATLWNMASNMVGDSSVHLHVIETMDDDGAVERMINDIQSRVKDMLKNIYKVFIAVHTQGSRISSSSTFTEIDGEIELKDRTKTLSVYSRYLKGLIADKNAFVKPELVGVVSNMMHTMSPRLLMQTLQWTSDNYLSMSDGTIDKALDIVMEHAIDYLSANRDISKTDLGAIMDKLRGAYMSSRSTDQRLIEARTTVEQIVRIATGSRNDNAVASVRTAWMLYVVARAYTMRYYASH